MLRPLIPGTNDVKPMKDYSLGERESALMQMEDLAKVRIGNGKTIEPKFAREYISLAKGTPKEESVPDYITAALKPAADKV